MMVNRGMEEDVEVLFESWMLKLTGLDSRSTLRLSSQWKKRYFVLLRQHESASLLYYNSKPNSLEETPKGLVVLEPPYKVEKKHGVRGQNMVVSLTTPTKRLVVAVDDDKIFHLFSFFLQVQTKLRDDLEDECLIVRPENSDDQRKIGARGNICLLHVSPWGLTVALQLSKCVLAQWPLSCIKNYESTGHGRFIVTVGKRACMGVGRYVFSTRLGQENALYDRLDHYVSEAAGLRYSQSDTVSQTGIMELESLQSLTYVRASGEFSNHLRKISRDIYDSLWQHFGTTTRRKLASPDLVSDSPHTQHRSMNSRSASMATLDGSPSLPTTPSQGHRRAVSQSTPISITSPNFSSLPRNFTRSAPAREMARSRPRETIETIDSQYLSPESVYGEEEYTGMEGYDPVGAPQRDDQDHMYPDTVLAGKPPSGAGMGGRYSARGGNISISSEPGMLSESQSSPTRVVLRKGSGPLQRQLSRSCENLVSYMEMNGMLNTTGDAAFTNNAYNKSPQDKPAEPGPGNAYSHASQTQIEETRAAAQKLAQRRIQEGNGNGSQATVSTGNQTFVEGLTHGFIQQNMVRHNSMKKAMSNPNIIDLDREPNVWKNKNQPTIQRPPLNIQFLPRNKEEATKLNSGPHTASPPGGLSTLLSDLPKGIHTTSKTKVFRRPSNETSPSKMMADLRLIHERPAESQPTAFTRDSNISHTSHGTDVKETHC